MSPPPSQADLLTVLIKHSWVPLTQILTITQLVLARFGEGRVSGQPAHPAAVPVPCPWAEGGSWGWPYPPPPTPQLLLPGQLPAFSWGRSPFPAAPMGAPSLPPPHMAPAAGPTLHCSLTNSCTKE